ncbi:MAG: phenylalanine--tRNA ligase subunit beta [Bacilli bacterium]
MKISTNWIKDYVALDDIDLNVLANKITTTGVNIEEVTTTYINNLVIGEVKTCVNHPNSNHLHVCTVDIGSEILQIVCGAFNVRPNLKVIVSKVGAILPGNKLIEKGLIRGVESNGMICALCELGFEDDGKYPDGIEELPSDVKIGTDAMDYLKTGDTVYTLDLNPNRNDCLSHLGFAYEVASVIGKKVKEPDTNYKEIDKSIKDLVTLEVKTDACLSYNTKIVQDVVIGPTPEFIKQRLLACGMRSINNVVDISNYIMLEYGQPLHFFDKDKLGDKIIIRKAMNEKIITLDKKERHLNSDDIVIANDKESVCIAGVMGGLDTEVDNNTKNILIESAIFNPYDIRYTSIKLDLISEASIRYNKKLNPDYALLALNRACHLLEKYASGQVLKDAIIYNKTTSKEKKVSVTIDQINNLLGLTLTKEDIVNCLDRLAFKYVIKDTTFEVTIPNRRMDIEENSADIIEEIGRLYGFDNITAHIPILETKQGQYIGNVKYRKLISKRLRSLGLNETRTYTLISESDNELFKFNRGEVIKLLKPLSNDKTIVRQSIIPSLLNVIDYNKTRGLNDVMIYEIANTYSNESVENTKIAIALKGNYLNNNWHKVKVNVDFYLAKGIVENLLNYLGFQNRYTFELGPIDSMHPGVSALICLDHKPIGYLGKVMPNITKDNIYVIEMSMNELVDKGINSIKHKEYSKYPLINKDLAFIIKKDIPASKIMEVIKKAGGRLLTNIEVFDVYEGSNLNDDEKSIAYALTFSDPTKTLTDMEVNTLFDKIIKEVELKTKAKLRSI